MNSNFMFNYTKSELSADVTQFTCSMLNNIQKGRLHKRYTTYIWFLIKSLKLILQYDIYNEDMNILSNKEYQNILNSMKQILNIQYNEFKK